MMDEFNKVLLIVRKYMLALIVIPLATIIITFFLVRNAPDVYVSQAEIATGIVDETQRYQQRSLTDLGILPNDQVNQEFSNLITMMQMKKMLDQVSYILIIHDLTSDKPFRDPSKEIKDLNKSARAHALNVYRQKYIKKETLNLWDKDQNGIYRVLTSMGYDSESLLDKLNIYRSGSSDFINVEFESEDPKLSALVVNTLSTEFIKYYSSIARTNKIKAANFLNSLLKEKSDTLAKRMAALRGYKITNRVLNLDEQSRQLYTSITEYDRKKQEAIQNTSSYAGALNELDRKFTPNEREYIEATLAKVNQDIVSTKEELSALYDLYYENDFETKYKNSIDSLQLVLSSFINKSSDQYLTNPLAAKQELVKQKIDLEVKLDISRYSINALEKEINRLNEKFDQLVPKEAEVQSFEMSIDIATKEYMDILNRYNQSSLESEVPIKLSIVQYGMPSLAKPSKKLLLIILSGVISVFFVLAILFVFFLMDKRIISAQALADKTQLPVIGEISTVNSSSLDLRSIWENDNLSANLLKFKRELRSIRYEIENDLSGKILIITSLTSSQGKTFTTLNLAFSSIITSKRVLIIDGNFSNSTISQSVNSNLYLEDFFREETIISADDIDQSPLIILKNRGGAASLLEVTTREQVMERLNWCKQYFDLILIEAPSFDENSQTKEWLLFGDSAVAIFENGHTITKMEESYISYMQTSNIFLGWILNKNFKK